MKDNTESNRMGITVERISSLLPKDKNGKVVFGEKTKFTRALGFSKGNVFSMWESGSNKSYIDYLPVIARKYGVTTDWLFGLTDDPTPPAEIIQKYRALDEHGRTLIDTLLALEYERCAGAEEQSEPADGEYIRHYLVPAAAGYAAPIEGEDYEEIPRPADAPEGADFCITVRGDSMEPYIPDGSLAYIRRGAQLQEFDVGIFFVDGDVFCKQWYVDREGTLHLLSANPKRQDANLSIPRDAGRSCVCFGKVLLGKRLPAPVYD